MDYKAFKKELESYSGLLNDQRKLEEEIKVFEYLMANVKAVRYDSQPGSINESMAEEKRLEMIERLEEKQRRLDKVLDKIRAIDDNIALLSNEAQYICNLSKKGKSYRSIGKMLGYSDVMIYLKVKGEVEKS